MFIQTEATPNPATLKFIPGRAVLDSGTMEFTDRETAARSPLAEKLFGVPGVTGVFYASLIIGVLDFTLKKYLPQGGTVFIYGMTILLLLWRPQGLFGRAA